MRMQIVSHRNSHFASSSAHRAPLVNGKYSSWLEESLKIKILRQWFVVGAENTQMWSHLDSRSSSVTLLCVAADLNYALWNVCFFFKPKWWQSVKNVLCNSLLHPPTCPHPSSPCKTKPLSCHDRRCQNPSPWKQCWKVWSADPFCDYILSDVRNSFQRLHYFSALHCTAFVCLLLSVSAWESLILGRNGAKWEEGDSPHHLGGLRSSWALWSCILPHLTPARAASLAPQAFLSNIFVQHSFLFWGLGSAANQLVALHAVELETHDRYQ